MNMLKVENLGVQINGKTIVPSLTFSLDEGKQLLISGASGTGKTTLLHALAGSQFHSGTVIKHDALKMLMVEQQHRFRNLSNTSNFYYQQRFNSADTLDAETLENNLRHHVGSGPGVELPEEVYETLATMQIKHLLPTRLIQLSNGENKRLQIARALLLHPDILLLDNPFVGLDVAARSNLENVLRDLISKGVHLVVSTSGSYCPDFFTDVILLSLTDRVKYMQADAFRGLQQVAVSRKEETAENENQLAETRALQPGHSVTRADFQEKRHKDHHEQAGILERQPAVNLDGLIQKSVDDFDFAIRMINVNIRYENRQILENINWEVRKGERWAISGHNGSGKSTLLSLVNADNPQAYANQIFLFDRKRGTGESIWDIKKKIGFVSPELHLFFDAGMSSMEVIASGLFDTIGLFRMLNEEQIARVDKWLELFQLKHLREKMFSRVSTGEQRLLLLARALVKDPPMLILDEPCQGLDDEQVARFRSLVDEIVVQGEKTLLYVSHYADEIPSCVDQFLVLEQGRRVK